MIIINPKPVFELFYMWYILGHTCLTISCKNSLNAKGLELKVKNISSMLDYVTGAGIWNKEKICVGGAFVFCFVS